MSESSKAPRVTTDCGVLEGSWMHTPGKRDIATFLGVTFAKPPVTNATLPSRSFMLQSPLGANLN